MKLTPNVENTLGNFHIFNVSVDDFTTAVFFSSFINFNQIYRLNLW